MNKYQLRTPAEDFSKNPPRFVKDIFKICKISTNYLPVLHVTFAVSLKVSIQALYAEESIYAQLFPPANLHTPWHSGRV
jgi:hypothetical protein